MPVRLEEYTPHKPKIQQITNRVIPVIEFVRHALLLGGVSFDVDNIAYTVIDKESRQLDGTVLYSKS